MWITLKSNLSIVTCRKLGRRSRVGIAHLHDDGHSFCFSVFVPAASSESRSLRTHDSVCIFVSPSSSYTHQICEATGDFGLLRSRLRIVEPTVMFRSAVHQSLAPRLDEQKLLSQALGLPPQVSVPRRRKKIETGVPLSFANSRLWVRNEPSFALRLKRPNSKG